MLQCFGEMLHVVHPLVHRKLKHELVVTFRKNKRNSIKKVDEILPSEGVSNTNRAGNGLCFLRGEHLL